MTEHKRKRITAADVARQAGVSRSAVSRAFTEGSYLDPAKREAILRAAAELGYRPNALAAGLQGGQSNLVAIFVGDLPNELDKEAVATLVAGLNGIGKWPIVIGGSGQAARDAVSNVLCYPLAAMVLRSGSLDGDIVDACGKLNVPVISMGRVVEEPGVDNVCVRNRDGMARGTALLIEKGRREFGFIGGPERFCSSGARRQGMRDELEKAGIELRAEDRGDYTVSGGYEAAMRLLDGPKLDALVCANDAMAIGALSALKEKGLDAPRDLSVIGFDDIPMAGWPIFDLTTLRNPIDDLVAAMLDLLTRRIETPDKPDETILLDAELIMRGTH